MKKTIQILIIIILLQGASTMVTGQTVGQEAPPPIPQVKVITRQYADSIRLRWAPEDAASWLMLNRTGYRIYRTCYDHPTDTLKKELSADPLMPWTLEKMKQFFGPADTLAAIAAQMIHGTNFGEMLQEDGFESSENMLSELMRTEEMQQQRFAMAMQSADFSFSVAEAMGLAFCDRDVEPGKYYVYGIEPVILPGMSQVTGAYLIVFNDSVLAPIPAPNKPKVEQSGINTEISWPRDFNTGFYIEKSLDQGKTFYRVNYKPFAASIPDKIDDRVTNYEAMLKLYLLKTHHIFSDAVQEGQTIAYRLRGITAFGELTPWSDTVMITIKPLITVPPPTLSLIETINNKYIRLSWGYHGDTTFLAGFLVYVSATGNDGFDLISQQLLPPTQLWFTDSLASRRSFNYYRVASIGIDGSQAESFAAVGVLNDETPPPPPTGLKGKIYHDGTLEVTWDASQASDVKGYRVLYANHPDHHFTPFSGYPLPPTLFLTKIPLNTLTRNLYVKVAAQDMAGNQSEGSEVLVLELPDIVPPPKPLMLKSSIMEGVVTINWSLSYDPEVIGYYVWRKLEGVEQWDLLAYQDTNQAKTSIWIEDKLPATGQTYLYTAEAMDRGGNSSGLATPVSFKSARNLMESIPIQLGVNFSPDNMTCILTWVCTPEGDHHYVITRGINGAEPMDYRSVNQGVKEYSDNRITRGMELTYSVYVIFKDGRVSQTATPVTVRIPQ
jgi:uncharacterized protein